MTDKQISRLFQVCEQIAALQGSLATPTEGTEPRELAQHHASILSEHQALLDELRSLLWIAESPQEDD